MCECSCQQIPVETFKQTRPSVARSNPESIYAHLGRGPIRSMLADTCIEVVFGGVGGGVALELSNLQASPGIIPEAEIANGCTCCIKRNPMQPCLQVGTLECYM